MTIKNGYQARLAKLAGNETVTVPAPRNTYEKLLDEIIESKEDDTHETTPEVNPGTV